MDFDSTSDPILMLNALRRSPSNRDAVALAVATKADDQRQALENGVTLVFPRPFDAREIRRVLHGAAPHAAQTARDLAGHAVVVKVDTEQFPSLAAQYNVRSIPNSAVFSRGQLQFQQAGVVDASTMESWLTRAA